MLTIDSLSYITFQAGHRRSIRRIAAPTLERRGYRMLVEQCEGDGIAEMSTPAGPLWLERQRSDGPAVHSACWEFRRPAGPTLATLALGLRKHEGDKLWSALHSMLEKLPPPLVTRGDLPPVEPWLGHALHSPLLIGEGECSLIALLDGLAQSVAWAWIDSVYDPDAG